MEVTTSSIWFRRRETSQSVSTTRTTQLAYKPIFSALKHHSISGHFKNIHAISWQISKMFAAFSQWQVKDDLVTWNGMPNIILT
jgi:hypothetical protein